MADPARGRAAALRPLRVAVVAPPYYELPPRTYGGVELVCFLLAEGLVDRGHAVTLVGSGARHTRAGFVATFAEAQLETGGGTLRTELVHAARAAAALADLELDVVHDHTRAGPLAAAGRRAPTVLSAHSALAGPDSGLDELTAMQRWVHLVAISAMQRRQAPELPWLATVPNGIPVDRYPLRTEKDGFLLYLGRLAETKGVHLAVEAARAAGRRLVIAGSWTTDEERGYVDVVVRPLLGRDVEWVGEVGAAAKVDLLGRAAALLFPARWQEPFGLVLLEAMACGTPVIGLRTGAVPELVVDGVTGVLCGEPAELPRAIEAAAGLSPLACRQHVRDRFDADRMVDGYEAVYRRVVGAGPQAHRVPS